MGGINAERSQKDSVNLMIRSLVIPSDSPAGFQPGDIFAFEAPPGTTLGQLMGRIFHERVDQIGVLAVNGKLASEETVLSPGDAIDVYPLLEGG